MHPAPASAPASEHPLFRVLRADHTADPDPLIPNATLLRAYREMRRLRAIDARMLLLQRQGRIGFYGPSEGQEAVPIATGLAVRENDWVFPALREQSVMLARGFPLNSFLAQIFGNSGDIAKGRQMPSHQSGRSVNQVSWSSCIATQLPHAVGTAWAMKLQKAKEVTVAFCGEGGTSEPDFHNAMNFAAVYHVPCVIVCQNNHWAISVPASRQTASKTFAIKSVAYGMPSTRVDGNDFLATYKVLHDAIERARNGGGPTFIEALTYRIGPHSSSDDPTLYRSNAEVEEWRQKDPLARLRGHLKHLKLITEARDAEIDKEIADELQKAITEVEALPPPPSESLFEDVYETQTWNLREQRSPKAP